MLKCKLIPGNGFYINSLMNEGILCTLILNEFNKKCKLRPEMETSIYNLDILIIDCKINHGHILETMILSTQNAAPPV